MPDRSRAWRRLFGRPLAALLVLAALVPAAGAAPADRIAAAAVELDAAGLERFKRAVGGARIVMLGEPWHGDGAAIAARARLVEVLHREMGFDVLVLEADFYALHRAWEQAAAGRPFGELARDNVYAFWGNSEAASGLWTYVDAQRQGGRPLIVAGIDTKLVGELSRSRLPDELRERFRSSGGSAEGSARDAETLRRLLGADDAPATPVSEAEIASLVRSVDLLAEASAADAGFDGQLARSLKHNLDGVDRDVGMADNLVWLATRRYPGRKLIVWAHNNHVLQDKWALFDGDGADIAAMRAGWPTETLGRKTYLGEATRHYLGGDAVYAIAAVTYAGRYSDDIAPALTGRPADFDRLATLEPASPGTLEAALHAAGHRTSAFVDLRSFRGEAGTVASRVLDYSQTPALPMRLWDGYDGLLYIDRTHGLNEPRSR